MTFNLNEPLAEAIDSLPVKNRSEWANKVLQEVLDGRQETTRQALAERDEDVRFEAEGALISSLTDDPVRALNIAIIALQRANLDYTVAKGRFTVSEQMSILRSALITGDRLKGMD